LSKIDLEVSDNLQFDDGDCAVIIKDDGSIGRVVMPDVNRKMIASEGYRKLLDVLEVLQPGARDKMINYAEKGKGSMH
jgi:hypothetical protein|tara:strand:+ start:802 stop:1035 length:234 start_codon:yes stop_codon:yes gene_type:complete